MRSYSQLFYGKNYAKKLLKYHQNGEYLDMKFKYFLSNILNEDLVKKTNILLKNTANM